MLSLFTIEGKLCWCHLWCLASKCLKKTHRTQSETHTTWKLYARENSPNNLSQSRNKLMFFLTAYSPLRITDINICCIAPTSTPTHTHTHTHPFLKKNIPHFHRWGLALSGESYNDYKLVVSNTLMNADVSSIMVTDTRRGLWVRHIQARQTTVMKNKCRCDLPSHNDKIFNLSRWEDPKGWRRERRSFPPLTEETTQERAWEEKMGMLRWEKMQFRSHRLLNWLQIDCYLFGAFSAAAPGWKASAFGDLLSA